MVFCCKSSYRATSRRNNAPDRARGWVWMMYEHAARILAHIGQLWQLTVVDPGRPAGALQEGSAASPPKPMRVSHGTVAVLGFGRSQLVGLEAPYTIHMPSSATSWRSDTKACESASRAAQERCQQVSRYLVNNELGFRLLDQVMII